MGGNGLSTKKSSASGLAIGSQAEILRAHQRDDEFVNHLCDRFLDLSSRYGRYKALLPLLQTNVLFKFVYFVVTSGLGNQTLGEEYTGIVQANLDSRNVPSISARIVAALLECFGERGLIKLLERFEASIKNADSELKPEAAIFLQKFVAISKACIPLLVLAHKGLFYTFGRYYSIGKRVTGIDYAKVRGKTSFDGVSWGLRLLGIATLAQCALRFWQGGKIVETSETSSQLPESNCATKCQLCLDATPNTATPCGHLFCWECLCDWLRTRSQCPLCRERVTASRIVHLMNL